MDKENKRELFVEKIKKQKKPLLVVLVIIALALLSVFIYTKYIHKSAEKSLYQVAVLVRDQTSGDKDTSNNLKAGDVLLYKQGEEHSWSKTERVSYLILKMNLSEEQARSLTEPIDRELNKDEKKDELDRFKEGREDIGEEELKRYEDELEQRRETVKMRKYSIDMGEFEGFQPNDLIVGQPFDGTVYDWKIVERN